MHASQLKNESKAKIQISYLVKTNIRSYTEIRKSREKKEIFKWNQTIDPTLSKLNKSWLKIIRQMKKMKYSVSKQMGAYHHLVKTLGMNKHLRSKITMILVLSNMIIK